MCFLERYSRKKSDFLSFILNEIFKAIFKKFLDDFLVCSNPNFEDQTSWKVTILKFREIQDLVLQSIFFFL